MITQLLYNEYITITQSVYIMCSIANLTKATLAEYFEESEITQTDVGFLHR